MKIAALVFPHQLYLDQAAVEAADSVIIVEDPLFFGDSKYPLAFHKQKLLLHRVTMRKYTASLKNSVASVKYIEHTDADLKRVFLELRKRKTEKVCCIDPTDDWLGRRLCAAADDANIELKMLPNPGFFNSSQENTDFFDGKKKYRMQAFYEWQRKRFGILLENDETPIGGKWSFDSENRKKLPKSEYHAIPEIPRIAEDKYIQEARAYVQRHYPDNPGSMDTFCYPTDHQTAERWLQDFLQKRFAKFGPYEDAMVADESFLFHGVLTPMLNIGLLTPQQVVKAALAYAEKYDVPLSSLEGFIRQIIGWREFMRAAYEGMGRQMRTLNHWGHERPMPECFYSGSSGIVPVDTVIHRVLDTGYCHHIERLMVLGNFFFLCEIHPRAVYDWFMELFIDAYDWVMVPNVYGMSQHADGGSITTKPYFSGSNYIRKMSDFPTGEWCDIWDGLYWRFIFKHQKQLQNNPRWAMMVRTAEKMPAEKKKRLLAAAEGFLLSLDS